MEIKSGQLITIQGHRCPYRVQHLYGQEDGTLVLNLMPTVEPCALLVLPGVHVTKEGRIYTEELEELEQAPPGTEPCKSCGALIRWSWTKAGKKTPMNMDGTSHFGTCPQAEQWRTREPVEKREEIAAEQGEQLSLL
jgi:hypothetical protein